MINFLFAAIIIVLIAADQVTKYIMLTWLKPIETYELIPGFIRFHFVENDGAAFSMLRNARWFFVIVTVVCVIVCLVALFSKRARYRFPALNSPFLKAALILIISGGVGNLIDRLFRGVVIDFIEPLFVNFAVFNFADILVTCGAAIIIIYLVADIAFDFSKKRREIREYKHRRR